MPEIQPVNQLDTRLMPQYEDPATTAERVAQNGSLNMSSFYTRVKIAQAQQAAQQQQQSQAALASAMSPTPDATNSSLGAIGTSRVQPSPDAAGQAPGLINRTGAPVDGTPSLGAAPPQAGQPQPHAAQPQAQPIVTPAVDMSDGAIRQRYLQTAIRANIAPDIIDSTLKMLDSGAAAKEAQITLAKNSSDARDRDITTKAFSDAGGDPDATVQNMLKAGATPTAIDAFQNQITNTKQHIATLSKDELENTAKGHDAMRGALTAFIGQDALTKQNGWNDFVQQQVTNGDLSKAEAANVPPTYPGDDAAKKLALSLATGTQLAKEEIERRTADHADAALDETINHNAITEAAAAARDANTATNEAAQRRTAQGELALKQKTFNATLGAGLDVNGKPLSPEDRKAIAMQDPTAVAQANYQIPPPQSRASAVEKAQYDKILAINPQYDGTQFPARSKVQSDFSPAGASGKSITAADTALSHLNTISVAGQALKNGDIQQLNRLANFVGAQTGSAAPIVYDSIVATVAPEISKAVIGAAGGEGDRQQMAANFSRNLPDSAREGAIGANVGLLSARVQKQADAYAQAMDHPLARQLSPESQAVIARYKGGTAPPPFPAQLSQSDVGKTYTNKAGKAITIRAVSPDGKSFQ